MANVVSFEPDYYPNPDKSRALAGGQIYVGIVDLDPTVLANQKQISVIRECGDVLEVSQPIFINSGGVPVYNGTPVVITVEGSYSMAVLDKNNEQTYYMPKNSETIGDIITVETLDDLQETPGDFQGQGANMLGRAVAGDGAEGLFIWEISDQSANVTADPLGGVYVAPNSDPTGATGAWIRSYNAGELYAAWFGALGSSVDSSIPINAAEQLNKFLGGGIVSMPLGELNIDNPIVITFRINEPITLRGVGEDRNDMEYGTSITTSTVVDMIQMEARCYYVTLRDFSMKNYQPRDNETTAIKAVDTGLGFVARSTFERLAFKNFFYGIDMAGDNEFNYADGMTYQYLKFETVDRCIKAKHPEASTINQIVAEPFIDYIFYLSQGSSQLITNVLARGVGGSLGTSRAIVAIILGTESAGLISGHSVEFNSIHAETINSLAYIGAPYVTLKNVHYSNIDPLDYPRDDMIKFINTGSSQPLNCTLENVWTRFVGTRAAGTYDLYAVDSQSTPVDVVEQILTSNIAVAAGLRITGWEPDTVGGNIAIIEKAKTIGSNALDVATLKDNVNQLMSDLRASNIMGLVQQANNGANYGDWNFVGGGSSSVAGITISGSGGYAVLNLDGIAPGRPVTLVFTLVSNDLSDAFFRLSTSSIAGASLELYDDLPAEGGQMRFTFITSDPITSERLDLRVNTGETGSISITDIMLFDGDQSSNFIISNFVEYGDVQKSYSIYSNDYANPT